MFLRVKKRYKAGKEHLYRYIVEKQRLPDGKVCMRQILNLSEINGSQKAGWCKAVDVVEGDMASRPNLLFSGRILKGLNWLVRQSFCC